MKIHMHFVWTMVGVILALSTTVNTMVASLLSPLISGVTGGKGAYV